MKRETWLAALLLTPVSLAQDSPRPHLDTEGKAVVLSQALIAVGDYWSTNRGIMAGDRLGRGKEGNSLLSDGYRLSPPKYVLVNGALIGGTLGYERYLKHKLPTWAQWVMRMPIWGGGVFFRGWVVTRNYTRGNRLINSQY